MGFESEKPLNVAVVRFPGSNCDLDTLRFFKREGHNTDYLWHNDTETPEADLLVLPGGFAFGDRVYQKATGRFNIDPGVQALQSPVMEVVRRWAGDGKLLLGICNGFQIMTHARLLPGSLEQNTSGQFFCDDVDLSVEGRSFLGESTMVGNIYKVNIAHGYGRYVTTPEEYQEMMAKGQIFMRYHGVNPNGSMHNIAGITNEMGNVVGMMPHPERADVETRNIFMGAIEKYVRG